MNQIFFLLLLFRYTTYGYTLYCIYRCVRSRLSFCCALHLYSVGETWESDSIHIGFFRRAFLIFVCCCCPYRFLWLSPFFLWYGNGKDPTGKDEAWRMIYRIKNHTGPKLKKKTLYTANAINRTRWNTKEKETQSEHNKHIGCLWSCLFSIYFFLMIATTL